MSNSFKADASLINQIIEYYKNYQQESNNDIIIFKASADDFSLLIYSNGTVFFQGKNALVEKAKWVETFEQESLELEEEKDEEEVIDHVGSDEVGCGDYFGPIVVCSSLVKTSDYQFLMDLGVRDSKQLNDDKIRIMAGKIKERIPYVLFVLTNKKYNEIYATNNYNLNKIKAYLHNFVLYKIVNKNKFKGKIVVDQFCAEDLYYKYLIDYKTKDIQRDIYFTTKAENKYLAVACASIIARATFLELMDEMSKELGEVVPLGASSKVDELAAKLLKEKGERYLKNYCKINYKNTEKIKDMIKE